MSYSKRKLRNVDNEFRHTGIWPFSLLKKVKNQAFTKETNSPTVKIFDPVALAFEAGSKLIKAGWVGMHLMPEEFLWKVVDAEQKEVSALAENWINDHKNDIADDFEKRIQAYFIGDKLAVQATSEALMAYRIGLYLATVRTLMPEAERFGRVVVRQSGGLPANQKEAVKAMQSYLAECPVYHFSTIESLTVYDVISEHLFAACFTEAEAQQLGVGPNRHAEVHGLASYGDLRGATKMLCVQDFLLHAVAVAQNGQKVGAGIY